MNKAEKQPKIKRETISVSLPTSDVKYLNESAYRKSVKRSYVVQEAINALRRKEETTSQIGAES